ncbi:fatty acid-binding protein, brain-like isoform X2 [Mercenaria mercenaria]|uniref:fatty acid-binding protein, brain-like isoform X2 n=1 Tax=Mercenaria mercenaria TaxID=6596 RepID=UPI00234EE92D|nr:fatty acid-binding protein, brain-like isoform X2 [Mercenaria mercenaria]
MASVIGKWKIDTCENFEEYMKATGVSEEKRADAHKYLSTGSNLTQEFIANVDGDSLVENQKGDGFECTHVRKGNGNTLTMTLTGGGQTCIRTFSKV